MPEITPDSAETCRLLGEIQAGDRSAFERLFARYRPYLHKIVEARLDPKILARIDPSDVVQEAQMEVYRRLPDFWPAGPCRFASGCARRPRNACSPSDDGIWKPRGEPWGARCRSRSDRRSCSPNRSWPLS